MATEKRLIYLEDAIAKIVDTPSAIAERVFNGDYGYDQNPDMLVDRQHEIIDLLMDVPTVEVVHGRWRNKILVGGFAEEWGYVCSECGCTVSDRSNLSLCRFASINQRLNYCPNCGASMMDGDGNEDV